MYKHIYIHIYDVAEILSPTDEQVGSSSWNLQVKNPKNLISMY